MFQTNRKYDRMAVRLSALIARLMAGESLVLSCLAQEFNVSERTLQRDLRERLAYLGVEGRQGCYRLPINTLKAYRDKDVLTFVKQIGMTRLFPGLKGMTVKPYGKYVGARIVLVGLWAQPNIMLLY
ncbi:HTH domain-containing protein [Providencia sneebia]|uniref:HTH deoR-type domain-containing protein n=1 Tax=Providencia sneebia DSM 19967 TaxID=1141660 RepID=K8W5G9_9GAMM|nr:hypothetical protein OO7_12674 [Providencia sneebia DSM 19967]